MKARTIGRSTNYMTAKTAGSGALTRTNSPPSPTPPTATAVLGRAHSMANKTNTKKPSKHTRPQSPPSKQSTPIAATNEQPKIMLESVQQQIQQEEKEKIKKQQKKPVNSSTSNDVDYDSAIEDEQEDDKQEMIHVVNTTTVDNNSNDIKDNKGDIVTACINLSSSNSASTNHSIQSCRSRSSSNLSISSSDTCSDSSNNTNQHSSPLPSPPVTPAATSLPDEFNIKEAASTGIMNIIHSEPVSPTMCTFDVQSVQQHQNHTIQIDNKPNSSNNIYVQQPIQRIHRLRPAASFATLRQLASTNNNYQHQQQHQQQQQQQQPSNYIQHLAATIPATTKRRPVSYIELSSNMNYNYAMASPSSNPTTINDDYLSVHSLAAARPTYYRRASSEDNRHHYHTRQTSDTNPSPPSSIANGGRRLVRSNTVHNLIIKDGQGHRIVQCVGLDDSPPLKPLRKNTSSFECTSEYQDWSTVSSTTATTSDMLDDNNTAIVLTRQQLEDLHFQAQQQSIQTQSDLDASSDAHAQTSQPLQQQQRPRKIKRKDSAKSLSSLCSTSPPINHDMRCEQLKNKLEKERATVKALQKQKEGLSCFILLVCLQYAHILITAYNKDVLFLSKNVDELSADNQEWKRKFDIEKSTKERFQDDLSSTMDKLNEATEQIRQLESQNCLLKQEIDGKNKEIRELEKKNRSPMLRGKPTAASTEKSSDRSLAAQLQHSQSQVRLLKSTMEQFLRMGVFNDDLSCMTSPTT